MEEINLEEPGDITEQRYLELAQQFQEQYNNKEQALREMEEKLASALKGIAVGYATLRLLDDFMDHMELEGPTHLVKKIIEMGREQCSMSLQEASGISQSEP